MTVGLQSCVSSPVLRSTRPVLTRDPVGQSDAHGAAGAAACGLTPIGGQARRSSPLTRLPRGPSSCDTQRPACRPPGLPPRSVSSPPPRPPHPPPALPTSLPAWTLSLSTSGSREDTHGAEPVPCGHSVLFTGPQSPLPAASWGKGSIQVGGTLKARGLRLVSGILPNVKPSFLIKRQTRFFV